MTQDDAGSAPMLGSVANRLAASLRDMNDEILARGADYSDILLDAARELDRRRPMLTDADLEAISAAACICEDAGRADIAVIINTALERLC